MKYDCFYKWFLKHLGVIIGGKTLGVDVFEGRIPVLSYASRIKRFQNLPNILSFFVTGYRLLPRTRRVGAVTESRPKQHLSKVVFQFNIILSSQRILKS
ncbi:MAG: hypothetical protein DWQ02_04635 [Bacteroidetes bacterium]|nr:MAG: hypothetical protein DWQ02_04635 [Bacteroidota bacterium]